MQLDFDSLLVVSSNITTASQTFAAWLNVRLMTFGLDSTTIVMRGPSLVLMGLAFSAVRYSLRRICCYGGERAKLIWAQQPQSGSVYGKQLVYVMSSHGNRQT
jgi:hypothetical protein